MNKKHFYISCVILCFFIILSFMFYIGQEKYQSSRDIDLQNAIMREKFERSYRSADNVCFAQRKSIFITKSSRTAIVDYRILNVIKGTAITVGDRLLLQYWNDSSSSMFDLFVSDEFKEFALIFISSDTFTLQSKIGDERIYRVIGDGFITYFPRSREGKALNEFLNKLSLDDGNNLQKMIDNMEIDECSFALRKRK